MVDVHVKTENDTLKIIQGTIETFTYKGFKYTVDTTASLISLVKTKGGANTVIGYTDERILAILDDTVTDRPKDTAAYVFKQTEEFQDWLEAIKHPMDQKSFIEFLKHRDAFEVNDLEGLIAMASQLKMVTIVTGEYDYTNEDNRTVMFKKQDNTEGKVTVPEFLFTEFPLIEQGAPVKMIIELEMIRPDNERQKPAFVLKCPRIMKYWKSAVQDEIRKVKEGLAEIDGCLVLAGSI